MIKKGIIFIIIVALVLNCTAALVLAKVNDAFGIIEFENYDSSMGAFRIMENADGGKFIGYLSSGDYLIYHDVDFGDGANVIEVREATPGGASFEIREDGPNGRIIANIGPHAGSDWTIFKSNYFNISTAIGIKDICFKFLSPVNIDYFKFYNKMPNNDVIIENKDAKTSFDAFAKIEAEDFNTALGIQVEGAKEDSTKCVAWINVGDYTSYKKVDFKDGATIFKARVSLRDGNGVIELREGSIEGKLLSQLKFSATGDWFTFKTVQKNIPMIKGEKDIYLVYKSDGININWITFENGNRNQEIKKRPFIINAEDKIEAEGYDKAEQITNDNGNISNQDSNNYVMYKNIQFGKKLIGFEVSAGSVAEYGGYINVSLDDRYAKPIARLRIDRSSEEFKLLGSKIVPTQGIHDIYLNLEGNVKIDWFRFTAGEPELDSYGQYKRDYPNIPDNMIDDLYADTWVATDELGRKLPTYEEVGGIKNKQVGIFYLLWHTQIGGNNHEPYNISEILRKYPEARQDMLNHPAWGPFWRYHFWEEPYFGYYLNEDRWVVRKHAEMLATSGLDVIIVDMSNGDFTWRNSYMELFKTFAQARADGIKVPQVAFMLNFVPSTNSLRQLRQLYEELYKPELFKDMWYIWKGKPLILAYPDLLESQSEQVFKDIKDFFTFRPAQPDFVSGPTRNDQWNWLEIFPTHKYVATEDGYEEMSVGIAQNYTRKRPRGSAMNSEGVYGRNFSYKDGDDPSEDALKYGANIQEQWNEAIKVNPEFVFITSWNEWTAMRQPEWLGIVPAFADSFDAEHSRDIEPSKGVLRDNPFYQMIANIRRYKGVRETPLATAQKTIDINNGFEQWEDVGPKFLNYKATTNVNRDYPGWGGLLHYKNDTFRNNVVLSKVSRDEKNLYFYVETLKDITPYTDKDWMNLLINTKGGNNQGWEGYEYIVNRVSPSETKAVVEKSLGGWNWQKIGEVEYTLKGNKMQLVIPRELIGLESTELDIEFKWTDNTKLEGDIMNIYENGNAAPPYRFNYRYTEKADELLDESVKSKLADTIIYKAESDTVYANGQKTRLDFKDNRTKTKIIDGSTWVPLHFTAMQNDSFSRWDRETNTVIINRGETELLFNANDTNEIRIINETVYMPLRKLADIFDYETEWLGDGITVLLRKNKKTDFNSLKNQLSFN